MEIANRKILPLPRRRIVVFIAAFIVLYVGAVTLAEIKVVRSGDDTAFQKLLRLSGTPVDWVVLGSSHALPLEFGDIPERLRQDTGQSMAVLAEIGAGPVYNQFVFRQSLSDIAPKNLLYVVDSFAFTAPTWNEDRIIDRTLLRQTPWRPSTLALLSATAIRHRADPRGVLDYLTGFSKLNPPELFPVNGWRGNEIFDRSFRSSRHAVASRIGYLYPDSMAYRQSDLDALADVLELAKSEGMRVHVIKPPLPETFRTALPDEPGFDRMLRARLEFLGIDYRDLSTTLGDQKFYFDTDHLNRTGVNRFYQDHLRDILAPEDGA